MIWIELIMNSKRRETEEHVPSSPLRAETSGGASCKGCDSWNRSLSYLSQQRAMYCSWWRKCVSARGRSVSQPNSCRGYPTCPMSWRAPPQSCLTSPPSAPSMSGKLHVSATNFLVFVHFRDKSRSSTTFIFIFFVPSPPRYLAQAAASMTSSSLVLLLYWLLFHPSYRFH